MRLRSPLSAAKLLAAALLAVALYPAAAEAQLVKCLDEKGRTIYTDQPGVRCKGRQVDLAPKKAPARGAARKQPQEDAAALKKRAEKEKREALAAKQAEERLTPAQKCDSAGLEFGRLSGGRPIVVKEEKGMRYFMTDGERRARMAALQAQLKKCQSSPAKK